MRLYDEAWNFIKKITKDAQGIWEIKQIIEDPINLSAYNQMNNLNLQVHHSFTDDVVFYFKDEEEIETPPVRFSTLLIFNINSDINSLKNKLKVTSNDFVKFCLEKRIKEIKEEMELQDKNLSTINDLLYDYLNGVNWNFLFDPNSSLTYFDFSSGFKVGTVHSNFWDIDVSFVRALGTSQLSYSALLVFKSREGVLRRTIENTLNEKQIKDIFLVDNKEDLIMLLLDNNNLVRFLAEKKLKSF